MKNCKSAHADSFRRVRRVIRNTQGICWHWAARNVLQRCNTGPTRCRAAAGHQRCGLERGRASGGALVCRRILAAVPSSLGCTQPEAGRAAAAKARSHRCQARDEGGAGGARAAAGLSGAGAAGCLRGASCCISCAAVGRAAGSWAVQRSMRSQSACEHSSGTRGMRSWPRCGRSPVMSSHMSTPALRGRRKEGGGNRGR